MIRNCALITLLIISGSLQTRDYRADYNKVQYEAGDIALKASVVKALRHATGKKAVIEKELGGIPVLTHEEVSRATVDGVKELSMTQNPSQAAEALAISLTAAKIVSYLEVGANYGKTALGKAANWCGITYFDNFEENHPQLSEAIRTVAKSSAHCTVKAVLQGALNDARNKE